jgi:hypothetical protein
MSDERYTHSDSPGADPLLVPEAEMKIAIYPDPAPYAWRIWCARVGAERMWFDMRSEALWWIRKMLEVQQ